MKTFNLLHNMSKFVCVISCEFGEKRATKPTDPCSTFHNNFIQPTTNIFAARQVDHAGRKTYNINLNLELNNEGGKGGI